jgi:hypothetical protein
MRHFTYTYSEGRRLPLGRRASHFISRATHDQLIRDAFRPIEPLSRHSWSVLTQTEQLDIDILRARHLAPAYSFYLDAENETDFLVTDRLFLRVRPSADVEALAKKHQFEILKGLSYRDYLVRVDPRVDVVDVVRLLTETEDDVRQVDHDLNVQPEHHAIRLTKPITRKQWYLFSSVRHSLVKREALVDCEGAWNLGGFGSPDVVVGVVDCGCDLKDINFTEKTFASWAVLVDGELFNKTALGDDKSSVMEPIDLHGTLCATLVAASANPKGGLGVAPGCRLLPVKLTPGSAIQFPQSHLGQIVDYLRDKVSVVSSSWGIGHYAHWPPVICEAIAEAAQTGGADGKGIVWIWSAGNRNCPIHYRSRRPVPVEVECDGRAMVVRKHARYFKGSFVGIPGVMHIGAISSLGQRCHYSNYGKGLTLVAPSANAHLYERLVVQGRSMQVPLGASGLYPFGGTSAAAPVVAGVAALVRSANRELTALETISILKRTATKALDMRPYPPCSRSVDPDPHWDISPITPFDDGAFRSIGDPDGTWSPWFGFGKVNARRAVAESMRLRKGASNHRASQRKSP